MIKKVELEGYYSVVIENDSSKQTTTMGIGDWALMFTSKQSVLDHISMLTKALEFWEYDEVTHEH
jgi:hypothetical protein